MARIIFKCILQKWDGNIDWIDLDQDRDRWQWGICECSNEHWGSINYGEFLD
jgi:hypothetical protein